MTTLLDDPPRSTQQPISPADRLRTEMIALRLSFTWFGTRKTLSPEQKAVAAESFGAEGDYLSAGKKLLNTKHPKFKAVSALKNRAVSYVKGMSLPYPEPGLRLIRQDDVTAVTTLLTTFQQELAEAVEELDRHFDELKSAARRRLGNLYNPADYPASLLGLFAVAWEFPSVEPPSYLRQLSPELYQQECRRIAARFDEAVQLAEQAFLDELNNLVSHLTERLTGQDDGKPKIFRDSAVENLTEFFTRFGRLNVRSNAELDELVERARQVVQDVQPQQLRDSGPLRQRVATQLSGVQSVLDGLLVDRPRRNILRRSP
jgi:hypothetical protein